MDTKQKFVRLGRYNEVIIFPCVLEHSHFEHFSPVTAGFCYIDAERKMVNCFGESISLGLRSDMYNDTIQATKQIFGVDAMINVMNSGMVGYS